ncbi:MAG: hypothetical protein Q8O67_15570 [Deltaproteobacteria bacterium]|nr:hypothetical protein [Deltaproteobacteria bacterium]
MKSRILSCLFACGAVVVAASCRGSEELFEQVTVTVVVVGVERDELAEIIVDDQTRRASPDGDVVTFALALAAGEYEGSVTIFKVEDDDDGEPRLDAERCGLFSLTVGDEPTATGISADDLESCDEDEGEEGEGEGEGEEGEGEGEGEGEEGEGEEGEGEGEGEGEEP